MVKIYRTPHSKILATPMRRGSMESEGKGGNEGKEATGTGRPIASKASRGGVLSYVQGHGQTDS